MTTPLQLFPPAMTTIYESFRTIWKPYPSPQQFPLKNKLVSLSAHVTFSFKGITYGEKNLQDAIN
jgi:hypothetical protein